MLYRPLLCARSYSSFLKMDAIIDYDEIADFLRNPPSLEPRPDFTKIRALCKHVVTALAQIQCPQNAIHGWSGLAVNPTAYQLLTGQVFVIPPDPGPTAVYPLWGAPNDARTINTKFLHKKNYFCHTSTYTERASACSMPTCQPSIRSQTIPT